MTSWIGRRARRPARSWSTRPPTASSSATSRSSQFWRRSRSSAEADSEGLAGTLVSELQSTEHDASKVLYPDFLVREGVVKSPSPCPLPEGGGIYFAICSAPRA